MAFANLGIQSTSYSYVCTVGGIVGITLVAIGGDGVDWWEIGKIAISWVSSPILGTSHSVHIPSRIH